MRLKRSGKYAFTLIELLLVIAIIALLLAVVVPALRKAKQHAQRIVCVANQHGIAVGAIAYMGDNQGNFMYQHPGTEFTVRNALTSGFPNWITRVWPYIDSSKDAFHCPSNKWRHDDSDTSYKPTNEEEFSYVANGVITYYTKLQHTPPASIVAFFDDYDNQNGATLRPHFRGTLKSDGSIGSGSNGWVGWMRYGNGFLLSSEPHQGRVNAFLDGHADWYAEKALTSRKYGLFIQGQDTFEPEGSSYTDTNRWGIAIVR